MDSKRAAEVLRYKKLVGPDDWDTARDMGAQALEAWAWVERTGSTPEGCGRSWQVYSGFSGYGEGPTPLAAVVDAMAKEGKR